MEQKFSKAGILISYLIGLPAGLLAILIALSPLTLVDEGLAFMGFIAIYGKATLGLVISFIYALWYAGKKIPGDILTQPGLLKVSFNYSLNVNKIIWFVFAGFVFIDTGRSFNLFFLMPALIAFVVGICVTTFTIGLLTCFIVRERMKAIGWKAG